MFSLKLKEIFLCIFMSLFTISCDVSSPTSSKEHTDADGFILKDENGIEFYREYEGAILTNNLTLSVGDTLELAVHFLDHDGNEIEHEDGEEEHEDELAISENDSNIAVIENEEEHEMAIHIIGIGVGSTSFILQLMHEGHPDYTSLSINILVNSPTILSCIGQLVFNNCRVNLLYA